jgi:hypothetical protein
MPLRLGGQAEATIARPQGLDSDNRYDKWGHGEDPRLSPFTPIVVRRRGRPPKPGGRVPQIEVQRAHRAQLAAAGKVVRIVDAVPVSPAVASPMPAAVDGFDPATQMICDRATLTDMRDRLDNAFSWEQVADA